MDELATRYAPGGDIYAANAEAYGIVGAERLWTAYQSGGRPAVGEAVKALKLGPNPPSTSTLAILANQLATDPLAAPAESLNRQLGLAVWNVLKNPFVLLALGLAFFFWVGGLGFLRKKVASA